MYASAEEELVDSAIERGESPSSVPEEKLRVLDGEYVEANPANPDSLTYSITARCRKRVEWANKILANLKGPNNNRYPIVKNCDWCRDADVDVGATSTSAPCNHTICNRVEQLNAVLLELEGMPAREEETQQTRRRALEETQQEKLRELEETQQKKLRELEETQQKTLRALEETQQKRSQAHQETQQNLLQAHQETQQKVASSNSEEINAFVKAISESHVRELKSLVESHAREVESHARELKSLVESHARELKSLVESHAREVESHAREVESHARELESHVRELKSQMELHASQLESLAKDLVAAAQNLLTCHQTVQYSLENLARAGNRTQYTLGTQADAQRKIAKSAMVDESRVNIIPSSPNTAMEILENCSKLELPQVVDNEEILQFSMFLQSFFATCKPSDEDYSTLEFGQDISKTVNTILQWTPKESGEDVPENQEANIVPSGVAQETKGAHPVLFAIMQKISSLLDYDTQLTHEQFIPRCGVRSSRFMDGMADHTTEHLRATMAVFLGDPIEIKPLSRQGEPFANLVEHGENQTIGHCMQILLDRDFNFGCGLGRDGKVRGIVLTMISIEIIEVHLLGVGTESVRVEVLKTGHLPLFNKTTTLHLLSPQLAPAKEIKTLCFKTDDDGLESGFRALVSMLNSKITESSLREGVHIPIGDTVNNCTMDLKDYLGAGAFSHVYSATLNTAVGGEKDTVVVKIPKSLAAVKSLENELKILKELSHDGIPSLYGGNPNLHEFRFAKASRTAHVGQTALEELLRLTHESEKLSLLEAVVAGIKNVLDYVHDNNVVHLDIQPSNIIVTYAATGWVIQVTDWGCAARKNEPLKYYRGCPPYSHGALLQRPDLETWKPDAVHDHVSFALTVAHLVAGTKAVPWNNCNGLQLAQSVLDDRKHIAVELLEKTEVSEVATLLGYLEVRRNPKRNAKRKR
eukprot:scaffold21373_cov57-Attheya_sp.AAC.6